jgi:TolB protein
MNHWPTVRSSRALTAALTGAGLALSGCSVSPGTASPTGAASLSSAPSAIASSASPTLSPPPATGAGRIAFVQGRSDGEDTYILIISPDGSGVTQVETPQVSQNEGPAWDPAGSLLFDSSRAGQIHLFERDGSGSVRQVTSGDGFEGFPAVSPDGQTIAFDNASAQGTLGLTLMDRAGGHLRRLVEPPPAPAFDSAPVFSPDGRQVAFVRKKSQSPPDAQEAVFIVNIDGSGLRQLTDWNMDVGRVRWAPDGGMLVFADNYENRPHDGAQNVWTIRPDGTGLTQLTRNAPGHFTFDPDFSPDGRHLVVMGWVLGDNHNTMSIADVNATNPTVIFTGDDGWFLEWPSWGP